MRCALRIARKLFRPASVTTKRRACRPHWSRVSPDTLILQRTIMTELRVGLVGLGAMGSPMAAHLERAGLLVGVGNRTFAKAQAFAKEHGVTAATPAELATTCNVIALCVSADADGLGPVREIAPAGRAGRIGLAHSPA